MPARQKTAAQYHAQHALRMSLGIGQCQGRAPGATEYRPALDAEVLAYALHVSNQRLGIVVLYAAIGCGTACTALIEQHDVIGCRCEELAMVGFAA